MQEDSAEVTGPVLLPLSAVKLRTDDRVVFTVDAENRLVDPNLKDGPRKGARFVIELPGG